MPNYQLSEQTLNNAAAGTAETGAIIINFIVFSAPKA